jgi:diaminopimelate epimerase
VAISKFAPTKLLWKKIEFYKYQGTGNDFVMIDDRVESFDLRAHKLIALLCHRKFGIGADGLILIRNHSEADFEMIYYNSDGNRTSLCGNGSRCAVKFANQLGIVTGRLYFMTVEGKLDGKIEDNLIHIKMPDVKEAEYTFRSFLPKYRVTPPHLPRESMWSKSMTFSMKVVKYETVPLTLRKATNVNFVEMISKSEIFVRTYERGVEDETLSCGTGVTAAALVQGLEGLLHQ